MGFVRFVGRSLLASYFIVNGARSVTAPAEQVSAARPLAEKYVPMAQNVAPNSVTLPTDPATIVRAGGIAQILGGVSLATGFGRRFGAATLLATVVPQIVGSAPKNIKELGLKSTSTGDFLKNLALAGATLLATVDTQGKPSLTWRAQDQMNRLAQAAAQQQKQLGRSTKKASKKVAKQVKEVTH